MGHIHSHNIVMQNCDALVSNISLQLLNVIYEYSCLVKCNVIGSLPLDRGGEAKPAELGFSGTNNLVGLRETPAGLSAAMRERYPDMGSTRCGFDAQMAPSG